ncbi:hypothetical protein BDV98DRAFT_187079 [Pterulicium gracile]|uniref:Uncharacterized protein n=1 Tax=Pterulicium gracile TaxID=1884261 RepID=A0A5C3QCB2_9AGAR|nr:hypothetical protein BDV98DRAFT_187079 [Pterula gracilis]
MAHSATIQLHRSLCFARPRSWFLCVNAACSIAEWANLITQSQMTYVDPILAILRRCAYEVLLRGLHGRGGSLQGLDPPLLRNHLETISHAMFPLSSRCPLMRCQLGILQEKCNSES